MYKLNKIYSNELEQHKFNNVNNQSILDNKKDLQLLVEWFKTTKELTIAKDFYTLQRYYETIQDSLLIYDDMNKVKEIENIYYHIVSYFYNIFKGNTPCKNNQKIPIHTLTVRVKCVSINTVLKIFGVKSVKKILNIPKKNIRNSINLQEIIELIGINTLYFSWSEFMMLNTTENSMIYTHMNKFNSFIEHFRYRHTYFY